MHVILFLWGGGVALPYETAEPRHKFLVPERGHGKYIFHDQLNKNRIWQPYPVDFQFSESGVPPHTHGRARVPPLSHLISKL